jgi:hypothetical protein
MTTDSVANDRGSDWLESALRSDAAAFRDEYLPDDGFTARVAATLPPPATLPAWRKPALALLWMVAAGVGALAMPDAFRSVAGTLFDLLGHHPVGLAQIATGIAATGAAGLLAAVWVLRDE